MCENVPDSVPENMEESFACCAPYNLHMLNSDDRLQSSTKNWPLKGHVTPYEKADAGFYYLDDSDQVICFYCGGGLKNWELNNNPWYKHAKWLPLCEYMLKKQGMDYVKDIILKYSKLNRPKLKKPCKANNVKIIHEILNDSRSTETKQKAAEWEVLMLLDPNVAYAKRWVLMQTKLHEH